eukprot:GHVT01007330.1.p1 GENE.GHVT01007330.1~~GHVT01007330.1.p1  ORF type:complete len:502 (-),score=92.49 GHVT01007330.1:1151-2656(-)
MAANERLCEGKAQTFPDTQPLTLAEELAWLKQTLPADTLPACFPYFVQFVLRETSSKSLVCKCHIPPQYPSACIAVEIQSDVLPRSLVLRLETAAAAEAGKWVVTPDDQSTAVSPQQQAPTTSTPEEENANGSNSSTTPANQQPGACVQLVKTFQFLSNILKRNKLLLCREEIKLIRQTLITGPADNLIVSEKSGTVTAHVEEGPFVVDFSLQAATSRQSGRLRSCGPCQHLRCVASLSRERHGGEAWCAPCFRPLALFPQVPHEYPAAAVRPKIITSNFPESINSLFVSQATEAARRCAAGLSMEDSLRMSDPARASAEIVQLSAAQYRRDVQWLKERTEASAVAVDKQARRDLRRFDQKEVQREKEVAAARLDRQKQLQHQAAKRAVPSLLPVCQFLVLKFVRLLPAAECGRCRQRVALSPSCFATSSPPERTFCGHWFHRACLEEVMTKPPFGLQCPVDGCTMGVFHAAWTSDRAVSEVPHRFSAYRLTARCCTQGHG